MTNLNANPRGCFIGIERVRQVNIAYTRAYTGTVPIPVSGVLYPRLNILCIYQHRGPIAVSIYKFHLPGSYRYRKHFHEL